MRPIKFLKEELAKLISFIFCTTFGGMNDTRLFFKKKKGENDKVQAFKKKVVEFVSFIMINSNLSPERDTPLNLSTSLSLASSTAPGSLSLLGFLMLLTVSAPTLFLGVGGLLGCSNRTVACSYRYRVKKKDDKNDLYRATVYIKLYMFICKPKIEGGKTLQYPQTTMLDT